MDMQTPIEPDPSCLEAVEWLDLWLMDHMTETSPWSRGIGAEADARNTAQRQLEGHHPRAVD